MFVLVCLFGYTLNLVESFDNTWTQLIAFYVSAVQPYPSVAFPQLTIPAYTKSFSCGILAVDGNNSANDTRCFLCT